MAYCNQSDLLERFGKRELEQLTDESAATRVDAAEITKACDEASSLIDGYVSTRYTTPLDPVPTIVRKWACDIVRKFLWKDRAKADSVIQQNYDATLVQLKDVAKSLLQLPGADGALPVIGPGALAATAPTAIFNTDGLL